MNFLSLLADTVLRSSLVLLLLFGLLFFLKRASAAKRHFVMVLGLIIVAVIPAGLIVSPHLPWAIQLPVPEQSFLMLPEEAVSSWETSLDAPNAEGDAISAAPNHSISLLNQSNAGRTPITLAHLLGLIFSAGAVVQMFILWSGARSWRNVLRTAERSSGRIATLEKVVSFASAKPIPSVFLSDKITIPVLVGWLRPVILLPRETISGSESSLAMILCHEIAHFRRGDALLLPLQWFLRILYWWHPLVWLALARLRREQEIASDDLVISRNFRATDYANLLVSTAREQQIAPSLLAGSLAMATTSSLGLRVTSILDQETRREPTGGWMILLGALAALCLFWPMIATQLKPTYQHLTTPTAAPATAPLPNIKLSFRMVFIDMETYQQHQKEMDAALAIGDPTVISKLPRTYLLSTPVHILEPGKQLEFSDVKPMTFPTRFDSNPDGHLLSSSPRTQDLGPTFTDVATLDADNQSVHLKFKCRLTYFKQWQELPSGGRKPEFGKKVFWVTRTIQNGRALWALPGAMRYLPPEDSSTDSMPADWPSDGDTSPKRLFLFVSASPTSPDDHSNNSGNATR